MMLKSYIIITIISGLALSQPVEENIQNGKTSPDVSTEQLFRDAEKALNRYYYLITTDTDHLVYGMLHMILNSPRSFPFIPHHALDIALKNLEKKLGQHDVDVLIKPILLSFEHNAQNTTKKPSVELTDELKDQIEDALDKFFEEQENISDV